MLIKYVRERQRGNTLAPMQTSRYEQIMRTFAKRLRKARKDRGYRSAQKFSALIGLEPHTYRKYERGQSEPNFEILVRICEVLQIETSDLIPVDTSKKGSKSGTQLAA